MKTLLLLIALASIPPTRAEECRQFFVANRCKDWSSFIAFCQAMPSVPIDRFKCQRRA